MQNNQLNRLLKLVGRTGDRLVVLDKETEAAVVMMEIDEYEKLLDGGTQLENMTEEDILDRINREVAIWREKNLANSTEIEPEVDFAPVEHFSAPSEAAIPKIDDLNEENDENSQEMANISQKDVEKEAVEPITVNPIVGEEEELKDIPDDGEEEKFYLEPV